jgi:hypothetical protein
MQINAAWWPFQSNLNNNDGIPQTWKITRTVSIKPWKNHACSFKQTSKLESRKLGKITRVVSIKHYDTGVYQRLGKITRINSAAQRKIVRQNAKIVL